MTVNTAVNIFPYLRRVLVTPNGLTKMNLLVLFVDGRSCNAWNVKSQRGTL